MVKPWSGRAAQDALKRVKAVGVSRDLPCCLCGAKIDYALAYPNEWSCSVEHVKSRKTHPHLTWDCSNWAPAHLICNKRRTGQPLRDENLDIGLAVC